MPTFLFEQPWIVGVIGAVLTAVSVFGWIQTGNKIGLQSGIGIAIVTIVLLLLNLTVETDREFLRRWVLDAAAELQNNEHEKIAKRIHPSPSDRVLSQVRMLPSVKLDVVRVSKIHSIEVETKRSPPQAFIRMNVFVQGESHNSSGKAPIWVGLTLEKVQDEWLVVDYEQKDPQHEFMKSSTDFTWPPK